MLQMAGWRWGGDVIRQSDVLDLLSRQTALNFTSRAWNIAFRKRGLVLDP